MTIFLTFSSSGNFGMLDGNARKLNVVVPETVIDGVIAGGFGRHRPGNAGCLENDGKGSDIFRPGQHFSGIVEQQDIRPFHIPGNVVLYSP